MATQRRIIEWRAKAQAQMEKPRDPKVFPFAERGVIGQLIAARRAEYNLTTTDLAQLAGISRTQLSNIERGIVMPMLPTLVKVLQALNYTTISFEEDSPCKPMN